MVLVIPHAMVSRSLTPNFIKLRTLVRAYTFIKSATAASSAPSDVNTFGSRKQNRTGTFLYIFFAKFVVSTTVFIYR